MGPTEDQRGRTADQSLWEQGAVPETLPYGHLGRSDELRKDLGEFTAFCGRAMSSVTAMRDSREAPAYLHTHPARRGSLGIGRLAQDVPQRSVGHELVAW